MNNRYDFKAIEKKWQQRWQDKQPYKVSEDPDKEKYYVLEMFPYPSGRIHMGHVRNYSIGDVIARYKRMRGYNVIHPMGWDAFGLPAENAAMKRGIHPAAWTYDNITYMRDQLKAMGLSYDWDREIATCNPKYYRWEQLIFLQMLKKGLVYRKETTVNWCADCKTVLAREQVIEGACWRCDQPVQPRTMHGWFFKITNYAEELLQGLDSLTGWPEKVVTMQRNWIGKSRGMSCDFPVENSDEKITIFTTRPDTIFGVTFMSLAVEHPLIDALIRGKEQENEVRSFIEETLIEKQRATVDQEPEQNGERRVMVRYDAEPQMMIAYHKPTLPEFEDHVFDVIMQILSEGRTSRLYQSLVLDKQLVTDVDVFGAPGSRYNNLMVVALTPRHGCSSADVEKALYQELDRLKNEPISETELATARKKIMTSMLRQMRGNSGLARMLSSYQTLGDWHYLVNYEGELNKVTAKDVMDVARRYLRADNRTVVILERGGKK